MSASGSSPLQVLDRSGVREIRLDRPERHNALDEELIAALTKAFLATAADSTVRVVRLSAEGKSFCAGADAVYMRRLADQPATANLEDARRIAGLFRAVRACPVPVVAQVQGAALGGGSGLIAACDRVVASDGARFGFTEVRLGIVPATISPFVVERIGSARARGLFASGEIFGAREAQLLGLVDRVVAESELAAEVDRILASALQAAPAAARAAKRLADRLSARFAGDRPWGAAPALDPALADETAELIARMRASDEGREGLRAFLEKRPASWVATWPPAEPPLPGDGTRP